MNPRAWTFQMTRLAFSSLGTVAPEPMAAFAERLYFSTHRYAAPAREKAIMAEGKPFEVASPVGTLAAWQWQPLYPWGPKNRGTVLLVHGWEGRASQLVAFVEALVEEGFHVIAADAPGHGRSAGQSLDLPRYALALHALEEHIGGFDAVIAHSFGGAATALALEEGLSTRAAVLVSPPCSVERFAHVFAGQLGLTSATEAIFRARLEKRFGKEWWIRYGFDRRPMAIENVPALIVHDRDDREIPFGEGKALAQAWPGAELLTTQGLGHRRILRDEAVVSQAVSFVSHHLAA